MSLYELVVVFMGADPYPFYKVAEEMTDCTMMIAYSD